MPTTTATCSSVVGLTPGAIENLTPQTKKFYEDDLPSALKLTLSSDNTYEHSHKETTSGWAQTKNEFKKLPKKFLCNLSKMASQATGLTFTEVQLHNQVGRGKAGKTPIKRGCSTANKVINNARKVWKQDESKMLEGITAAETPVTNYGTLKQKRYDFDEHDPVGALVNYAAGGHISDEGGNDTVMFLDESEPEATEPMSSTRQCQGLKIKTESND